MQVCTSMAAPWNVMEQLEKWLRVLQVFFCCFQNAAIHINIILYKYYLVHCTMYRTILTPFPCPLIGCESSVQVFRFYFIKQICFIMTDALSEKMSHQVFNLSLNSGKLARWENYSEPGLDFPSSPRRYSPTTQVLFTIFQIYSCKNKNALLSVPTF